MPRPKPARSGGAGEEGVDRDAPFFEEPFGDVDAVPILPAPDAELTRRRVHLGLEVQALDLQFEFGGDSWSGRNGTPPIGVPAFARGKHRRHHRPKHTPQQVSPQENLHSGERGLLGINAGLYLRRYAGDILLRFSRPIRSDIRSLKSHELLVERSARRKMLAERRE